MTYDPTGRRVALPDDDAFRLALARAMADSGESRCCSTADMLVLRLREMAQLVALDAVVRPGAVAPARLGTAIRVLGRLADELTARSVGEHPVGRAELEDIAAEAVDILRWVEDADLVELAA